MFGTRNVCKQEEGIRTEFYFVFQKFADLNISEFSKIVELIFKKLAIERSDSIS